MLGDNERSGAYASEQRRLLRAAVADEVFTFTAYWREAAAEVDLHRPTEAADLRALPPRPLSALGAPDALVLRPSVEAVRRTGPRPLRRRLRRSRFGRDRATAGRRILDPLYKPVHWIIEEETPVGCTEADLVRLAELGRRTLDLAGVTPNDAIVGLVPPGPTLSTWQLALGAREAGVPLAGLSPSTSLEAVAMLGPTVLAGRPTDLLRVIDGVSDDVRTSLVTVLTIGRVPLQPGERTALEDAVGSQASVVEVWSPPGLRALWAQCRGGEGVHTWPQTELLEVCGPDGAAVTPGDEGDLIWTGLGWRGSVLVRLATGMRGRLVEGRCETCGRTTPRVVDARSLVRAGAERAGRGTRGRSGTSQRRRQGPSGPSERGAQGPSGPSERGAQGSGRPSEREAGRWRRSGSPVEPDEPDVVVGPEKSTGGIESVRTVRSTRKDKAAARSAARSEVADDAQRVAERELAVGTVRAVVKDEPGGGAGLGPAGGDDVDPAEVFGRGAGRERSSIGEVGSLPAVPEVGPDAPASAPADRRVDPWLPDTGEVDAWPAPVLASVDGLAAWQVEHRRRRGHGDELVVHLALADGAELGEVLVSLERSIGATQYVLGDEASIAARIAGADGLRVVDRRSRRNGTGTGRPLSVSSAAGSAAGNARRG